MNMHGLQVKNGEILKKAGYEKSKYERYSYTLGYRFHKGNQTDISTTYLKWGNANMLSTRTDAQMIESIYSELSSNGLADYLQPLNKGDEIIRLKNVEY